MLHVDWFAISLQYDSEKVPEKLRIQTLSSRTPFPDVLSSNKEDGRQRVLDLGYSVYRSKSLQAETAVDFCRSKMLYTVTNHIGF